MVELRCCAACDTRSCASPEEQQIPILRFFSTFPREQCSVLRSFSLFGDALDSVVGPRFLPHLSQSLSLSLVAQRFRHSLDPPSLLFQGIVKTLSYGHSHRIYSQESCGNLLHDKVTVIFVLGGPGSGKGTQCANIVEHYGFTHLSAGDLLRSEIKSGSENGTMIQNMIQEGKIVPSVVTIKLLQTAILGSRNDKFLIDGFPRNEENRAAFERVTGIIPEFILFFDCSEEEMEKRLLGRNQGRVDDNIETIRKRFKVFVESSLPVVQYYDSLGKVKKIDAAKSITEVFEDVKVIFSSFAPKTA